MHSQTCIEHSSMNLGWVIYLLATFVVPNDLGFQLTDLSYFLIHFEVHDRQRQMLSSKSFLLAWKNNSVHFFVKAKDKNIFPLIVKV